MGRAWGTIVAGTLMFAGGFMPWVAVPFEKYLWEVLGRSWEQVETYLQTFRETAASSSVAVEQWYAREGSGAPSPEAKALADRFRGEAEDAWSTMAGMMTRMRGGNIRFNAWETELEPLDIGMPNWIVPVIGLVCAILAFVALKRWVAVPWQLPFALALYALAHAIVFAVYAGRGILAGLGITLVAASAATLLTWRPTGTPVPAADGPTR